MRKTILGAASALTLATPVMAADLPIQPAPRYSEAPAYEYRPAPPVVVEPAPVFVAPPPVVVEEYPVYPVPPVYAAPPVYAYAGPVWRGGWGHRGHFHGRW
jgi:hypothetical protein